MKAKDIQITIITAGTVLVFGLGLFSTGIYYSKKAKVWEDKYNKSNTELEALRKATEERHLRFQAAKCHQESIDLLIKSRDNWKNLYLQEQKKYNDLVKTKGKSNVKNPNTLSR
jgi:hypothetical protein